MTTQVHCIIFFFNLFLIFSNFFLVEIFRENSFNLSLNGKDILENDSVLLRDLGIVNGDLIHVLLNNDEEEITSDNLSAPGSSRSTVHSTRTPSFHSTEPVAGPSQVK